MRGQRARGYRVFVAGVAGGLLLGCACESPPEGAAPPEAPANASPTPGDEAAAARQTESAEKALAREAKIKIAPVSDANTGGMIALGLIEKKRAAFIADEDDASIRTVDLATRAEIGKTALPGRPGQILLGPDGRLYVALRDNAAVAALEVSVASAEPSATSVAFIEIARLPAPTEPVGLAVTPDKKTLLVTSGWGRALTAFTFAAGERRFSVDLPREPRAVLVSNDGARAFVSHTVGSTVSVVDLTGEASLSTPVSLAGTDFSFSHGGGCMPSISTSHARAAVQGFALARVGAQVLAPHALVSHEIGHAIAGGYGGGGREAFLAEEPAVAQFDEAAPRATLRAREEVWSAAAARTRSAFASAAPDKAPCLLPRAAATNPERSSMLVACLGIDAVVEIRAEATGLREAEIARWKVPSGPIGIAVDGKAQQAWVWSQFSRSLSVIALGDKKAASLALARVSGAVLSAETALKSDALLGEEMELGRQLFHAVGDRRISADGRVCASCHPDGRDDGLVWSSPNGQRQTPMLAGRLEASGPFGWEGDTKTVGDHLTHTFQRLAGRGLAGKELDALVRYAVAMPAPPRSEPKLDAVASRGRELFESQEVGCAVCHTQGGVGTDGSRHDVGSGAPLDTPTLRFIAGTAPYFHDGRYATLGDLLRATQGKMGWASGMTDADFDAIEAYLKTL